MLNNSKTYDDGLEQSFEELHRKDKVQDVIINDIAEYAKLEGDLQSKIHQVLDFFEQNNIPINFSYSNISKEKFENYSKMRKIGHSPEDALVFLK